MHGAVGGTWKCSTDSVLRGRFPKEVILSQGLQDGEELPRQGRE